MMQTGKERQHDRSFPRQTWSIPRQTWSIPRQEKVSRQEVSSISKEVSRFLKKYLTFRKKYLELWRSISLSTKSISISKEVSPFPKSYFWAVWHAIGYGSVKKICLLWMVLKSHLTDRKLLDNFQFLPGNIFMMTAPWYTDLRIHWGKTLHLSAKIKQKCQWLHN